MDMENCIFIYSFDKSNELIDSELLFCTGGGLERQSDVLIEGKIVNTLTGEKKAVFVNNKYVSVDKEYYSLRDTLNGTTTIEIGRQKIIEYEVSNNGGFKTIKKDYYEKEYSKAKYWYN